MAVTGEGAGAELLMSPIRRRIMDLLVARARAAGDSDPDGMTAAEISAQVGLHVTTVRFHLDQMLAAGLLVSSSARGSGAGRPRKIYAVSVGSLNEVETPNAQTARAFEALAELLAKSWTGLDQAPISPQQAGYQWSLRNVDESERALEPAETPGQWLDRLGKVVDLLAEWGYTGEVTTSQGGCQATIKLANCPFLELARERPDVVCGVHRGLLAGALEAYGEADPQVSLQPFVTSRECLAHVTRQQFTADRRDAPKPNPATSRRPHHGSSATERQR